MSSADLLREYAANGSETAFAELTARHMDLVYSAALRIVGNDAALASDVVQLVFTDLARGAPKLPSGVVLSGWLYRHTCFTASKMVRSEKRRQARERQAVEMQALNEDESVWQQLAPVLDEAMSQLDPSSRDAILLRFFERQPLRQVGLALGVTEDNARKRVERAVAILRKYLLRRGVCLSAATLPTVLAAKAVAAAPAGLALGVAGAAVASAAAAHTAVSFGLTQTLTMTTLQKVAVITVVAAALGTAVYEACNARHSEQRLQSLQQQLPLAVGPVTAPPRANPVTPATPAKTFDWQQVESEDYRQYLANLRAIGCPEKTIRDIITADVNDLFHQRLKAALSTTNRFEYWKPKSEAQLRNELATKPQELAKEKRELLKVLLGEKASEQADVSTLQDQARWIMERMWDFLTPEKQTAIMELQQQYGARLAAVDRLDAEGERRVLAEQDAELRKLLSPDEKFEWDLRSSVTAAFMKAKMGEFEPTEQEYRQMFPLQKQYDDQYGPAGFAVLRGDSGDATRKAADDALQSQFESLLGAERYRQYAYESRWPSDFLRSIATENHVPKETAFKAYDIEKETLAQAGDLPEGLPEAQRQAALAAMAAEAEQAVEKLLGPAAGPEYVKVLQEHGYLRSLRHNR